MQICVFEGIYYEKLEPLIFSRPAYDLVCGINTLREKILRAYPEVKYSLHCRSYLTSLLRLQNHGIEINSIEDDECLFINGNILAPPDLSEIIPLKDKGDKLFFSGDSFVAISRLIFSTSDRICSAPCTILEQYFFIFGGS